MIIHGVLVGLAVMNIVFAFINLFIQKEGRGGWFCSLLGWSVALMWILK
jgi:hypothetical protein